MNSTQPACPDRELLADFLLGKLPSDIVDFCESHLAECPPCTDTIQALNANDTLSELTRDAFGSSQSTPSAPDNGTDQSVVQDLIERMKQLRGPGGLGHANVDEKRAPIEARSAEVQQLFLPCENDQANDDGAIGQFAHYRIRQLLGAGSTGVVYLASDENLDRLVALKILRPSLGQAARDRFIAEARATAAMEATNVVSIYHVGTEGSLAYIAMQWTAGETLEQRLERENTLGVEQVRSIAKQIALGLSAAHHIGLIHRDIKPANIWLESETDNVKILDFGLVRATDEDPQLTCTGMIAGTPCYMSPEQSRGAELDPRSDFFSLGCLLYESLTGRLPFRSSNVLATLQSIQRDAPTSPCELDPNIPEDFSSLVMSLLEKSPAQRPPNADAIVRAVTQPRERWTFTPIEKASSSPTKATAKIGRPLATKRSGIPWWVWLAGLTGCALLALGGFMAPQIVRIVTNQGELVIDSNDPNIKIEILNDGERVQIVDLTTEQSIDILAGKYQIRPLSDENTIAIDKQTVVMSRGGKQIVKITRIPDPAKSTSGNLTRNETPTKDYSEDVYQTTESDPLPPVIQREIRQLWLDRLELSRKYGPKHPKVVQIDQQLNLIAQYPKGVDMPLPGMTDLSVPRLDLEIPETPQTASVNLKEYQIEAGDILGVFVDHLLGEEMPKVHMPDEQNGILLSSGHPVVVTMDGTISLPLIKSIPVKGKKIREVIVLIESAYRGGDNPILKPDALIDVTLIRPRRAQDPENLNMTHRLTSGDVIGLFIEHVVGGDMPVVHMPDSENGLEPSTGFPVIVSVNGKISLPLIEPIKVEGRTISETLQLVKDAYYGGETPILKPEARISVTLMKKGPKVVPQQTANEFQ